MKLKDQIKKFQDKIDVGEMEKAIKRYRKDLVFIRKKLDSLSLRGAVEKPLIVFFSSLFFSLLGMYLYSISLPTDIPFVVIFILFALGNNAIGIGFLYRVLQTVEWAASRIPLPKFDVFFSSLLRKQKVKTKEKTKLRILISNDGEKMAEDLKVMIAFPPSFKITPARSYQIVKQGEGTANPGYNAVVISIPQIHMDINMLCRAIDIEAPEKPETYKIPVRIGERHVGVSDHELFIVVE